MAGGAHIITVIIAIITNYYGVLDTRYKGKRNCVDFSSKLHLYY